MLLLTGLSGWVVGDLVRLGSRGAVPRPSGLSDVVYLLSCALLGAGVLAMVRTRRSGSDRAAFLDAAVLATGAAVLMATCVIAPVSRDASLGVPTGSCWRRWWSRRRTRCGTCSSRCPGMR